MRYLRIVVAMALIMSPAYATELKKRNDVEAFVVIGPHSIPIGVEYHFSDVASLFPKPGELITDPHDNRHNPTTYCYHFIANDHQELLELFDSDFGMFSAKLTRGPDKIEENALRFRLVQHLR